MAENKNNLSINDDHSNAAMTHTSDAIASSDFIIRELDLNQEPEMQRESKNFWQDAWAQLKRNKLAVFGMIGLIIIVIFAFIGPVINKHDYAEQNVEHRNLPAKIPVLDKVPFLPFDGKDADGKDAYKAANAKENYWFGTDQLGRDLWTRTWKGAQISLFIGVVAAMLDIFIGVVYGAISGFFGGRVDTIMQRILEVIASIPNLIVVILFVLIFEPSIWTIILAMSITGWLGMSRVVRGEFLFLGEDLAKKPENELIKLRGKDISMIFQDPMTSLNPTMQIGKQVMEPLIKHKNYSKAQAKKRALEILNLVGLPNAEKRFKAYPHQFSGGQRQRIVIATALACEPKVLIADEPTTALDVTMQAQILDLMKELQQKIDTAIIFITHDLGVVANIADRVAVMYGGQMVETGDVNEIFYDPKHPYTWGLLSSMPDLSTTNDTPLLAIPGAPPDLLHPPKGDAFARRSQYALDIDFKVEPPWFKVSPTHFVKSWLLDARAPKVELPELVKQRMKPMPNNYEKPLKVERVSFNEK
ncbi:hypothetical protein AXE98_08685 [Staphylococcus aureus]|nr:hypothetical protein [Staphylococcus aureus]